MSWTKTDVAIRNAFLARPSCRAAGQLPATAVFFPEIVRGATYVLYAACVSKYAGELNLFLLVRLVRQAQSAISARLRLLRQDLSFQFSDWSSVLARSSDARHYYAIQAAEAAACALLLPLLIQGTHHKGFSERFITQVRLKHSLNS